MAEQTPQPATQVAPKTGNQELSSGAQVGVNIGIGVGNVCCGPTCYCLPSVLATTVGVILYFVWKDEKPETAKRILMVTLITAGVAILLLGTMFVLGIAGSLIDQANF